MKFHCMFEQSGTFKNEFKALGYEAYDYDILDDFGETDFKIDLFKEIEKAYDNKPSVFDDVAQEDTVLAFYPCTRFENQIGMHFRGTHHGLNIWNDEQKLEYVIRLHEELHNLYVYITKMRIVAMKRGFKMIIENPYSSQHYLVRYWPITASLIDPDRTERGDYYTKPTQYWFINCTPSYNFIFEPQTLYPKRSIANKGDKNSVNNKVERSLISREYANRFIREFIL